MKELIFEGIDDWNRPVFKHTESKERFGSVDVLFNDGDAEETVQEKITEAHLLYFGNSFNEHDPLGAKVLGEIKIQWRD